MIQYGFSNVSGQARALYAWHAEEDDELTIEKGDLIENVKDGGWWEGEINGKRGFVPKNFVKLIGHEETEEKENPDFARRGN